MAKTKATRKRCVGKDGGPAKGTTYFRENQGKPSKTPTSEKWYQHTVEMNWAQDQPARVRRAIAIGAQKGGDLA